ncbi:MAG: hypothetical protein AB2L20_07250 [Mangrovibacterium sp.]
MKKMLLLFALAIAAFACKKDDDGIELQLNMKSCVLNNENSSAEVKVERGEGFLTVTSSDPDVAEVLHEDNGNIFYIIGHGEGNATVTVGVSNEDGAESFRTIDVRVSETINYHSFSAGDGVYLKKAGSRIFELPFNFEKGYTVVADAGAVIDSEGVAAFSAGTEMGNKFRIDAKNTGSILFHICKGIVKVYSVRIYVVDEYDLFVPPSEDRQLTFKLPFTYGINGITIWRGSGQYTARIADEAVAQVKSVTPGEDVFNSMNNSAVARVNPLKTGTTKMIITDTVTGQTHEVDVVVN